MSKTVINTKQAPEAIGPYSQGIKVGDFLYVSGQLPIDPLTGKMSNDISAQAAQSLSNIKAIIEEAEMNLENVVKVNVFLSDMNNFITVNKIYSDFFSSKYPARAVVEVSRLPKDAQIEIEAVAFKG